MNIETFYRMTHDVGLPCQHCGKKINLFEMLIEASLLRDGRVRRICPHCAGELPQTEYRDYGVPQQASKWSPIKGFPEESRHWSVSHKNFPLWAINK